MESIRNITKKSAESRPVPNADLGIERQAMNDALARFGIGYDPTPQVRASGHLLFGLDLTQSREPTLEQARIGTAAMFDAIAGIGNVSVKLAWYRGRYECEKSQWYDDPGILCRSMLSLSCQAGGTKIIRLLRLALEEETKLSGMVFIGDHCEEDKGELLELAKTLGRKSIPLFIFHESVNSDARRARGQFKKMAKLSGGAYMEFKPDSGTVLREALTTLAAFAVGGMERIALPRTAEALNLQGQLRLMPMNAGHRRD